ncbi:MAG: alkaline phosphatase [Candidatus Heimdallarchaeota archaeon]|nr:alkaline phosphatase [Candidatus Heimdallarchaeota archaeon]MBY8994990.1 alkaline phosphatase [Candidatus Heimdallarchaeota archaeon]
MNSKLKLQTVVIIALTMSIGFIADKNLPSRSYQPTNGDNLTIILMIGDGMGFEQVRMARFVEVGKNANLIMESSLQNFSVMTHNVNLGITDSAAAATAMATGIKTNNGRIAVDPDWNSVETILEIALELGKATGVVSTTTIQHATPASFMTHVYSRGNYQEITRQIVENANVDVLLGGGLEEFSAQQILDMTTAGYSYVTNKTALDSIASGRILGLFSQSHMPYEQERNFTETPSLAEMTRKAIEILQQNSSGFFLMVEGGKIDHASHDNEKVGAILEAIAFDQAVREAKNYVETHANSILIVTADHETGGPTIISENLDGSLPITGLTEEQNRTLRITRANQIEVDWSTGGHTRNNVPMFAFGDAFENIKRNMLIDNTDIFGAMNNFIHNGEVLFIDRASITMVATYFLYIILIPLSIILIYSTVKTMRYNKRKEKNS